MHGLMYHRESGEQRPAMVGLVEHVEHGQVGIHVTYLAIDGSMKATITPSKKFFGLVSGGAVRLGPVRPGQWLIVGEGIESTASAMQLWGLSSGWAGLSASGIRNLILPPEARLILIACDNDANGVGQAAARDAAWMWEEEGRAVRVALPPTPDTDFNDVLIGAY
jgi:putative DNA primase/helicase